MKHLPSLYLTLFLMLSFSGPNLLEQAKALFQQGKYLESKQLYKQGLAQYPSQRPAILYNMAQCYEAMDSISQALSLYHRVTATGDADLKGKAFNHIGILLANQQKYPPALESFRKAIDAQPFSLEASYNYELLKRIMEEAPQPPAPDPRVSEENDPAAGDEPDEGEETDADEDADPDGELTENSDDPPDGPSPETSSSSTSQQPPHADLPSSQPMDTLDLEAARRLLDGLRENERQFMQQLKRRSAVPPKAGEKVRW